MRFLLALVAFSLFIGLLAGGCAAPPTAIPETTLTYREDVEYLRAKLDVLELQEGAIRVAVCPSLQGRVMTSSFSPGGLSLGWVNRAAVEAGEGNIPFNNYGGQDRFWLGPEGGPYTLFHQKGDPQSYDTWTVPDALNKGAFDVVRADAGLIQMRRHMRLSNAEGTAFNLQVDRTIRLLRRAQMERLMGTSIPLGVMSVGFVSENRMTNAGDEALRPDLGTVAIRILGMYPGRDHTVVMAPFQSDLWGPTINTAYFPNQPANRIAIDRQTNVLLFRGDGNVRSKFGIRAEWAKDRIASIDFTNRVLTIVLFDRAPGATRYVNSIMDADQKEPYAGDVVGSYNHGGADGLRFYNLESASPGAFLEPGESLAHAHRTLQFQGPLEELSKISSAVLGIALDRVAWEMP